MNKTNKTSNRNKGCILLFIIALVLSLILLFYKYGIDSPFFFPKWKHYEVYGVDVSRYQHHIDWKTIEKQGIAFAFVKATEGNYLVDVQFKKNWYNLSKTNIRRGAYHFYRPEISWKKQAKMFINTVEIKKGDLPPVLDIEVKGIQAKHIEDIKKWLNLVEAHYGMRPIVYSYQNYYNKHLKNQFKNYNLWIAKYSNFEPFLMDFAHWEFWQYSETGRLKGVKYPIDLNCFYGNIEQLDKMTKK